MTPWLSDAHASRWRRLLTGALRVPPDPVPELRVVPPRVAMHGRELPCAHSWCVAYAAVGSRHCFVHGHDDTYRPSDVRGRYPRWMSLEVFGKGGTTRRRGPVVGHRLRYDRAFWQHYAERRLRRAS